MLMSKEKNHMKALFEAIANHDIKTVRILIQQGADLNAMLPCGTTPLIMAARKGEAHIVKTLLNRGAYIHAAMQNGNTAFTEAVYHGDKTTMIILLQYGANLHDQIRDGIEHSTFTAIQKAVLLHNQEDIQNLDYTRSYPSALDLAIMVGNIDAVTILLNRGVKHNLTSCLHTALFAKRQTLVQFFIDRGATPPTTSQGKLSLLRCMSLFTPVVTSTDQNTNSLKNITKLCYDTHNPSRTSL
jgi:ankyrin repeat protein